MYDIIRYMRIVTKITRVLWILLLVILCTSVGFNVGRISAPNFVDLSTEGLAIDGTVNAFHKLYYYSSNTWLNNTSWLGVPAQKCPLDLWVYQEILYDVKPDVIIEAGTYKGGSALYLASIFDLIGKGRVITIDIAKQNEDRPVHDRVTYLLGSSTSDEIVHKVEELVRPTDKVMVVLDSDHSAKHVLEELRIYHKYVTPGSFLIVEDGNINGNPILPDSGPGPGEALE